MDRAGRHGRRRAGAPGRLAAFRDGLLTVQDEAAMRPAAALAPQSGQRVLDLCSGVGGKATHLAELMANRGRVVAVDLDAVRLARGRENRARLGLDAVAEVRADARRAPLGEAGAAVAAPSARLVYSTCSIEEEEDERVVTEFSRAHPEWRLAGSKLSLPEPGRGGGFWALWVRPAPAP